MTAKLPFDPADAGFGPDYDPTRDPDDDDASAAETADADDDAAQASAGADVPLPDKAWHLFCRGRSYAAIARILRLDRHTVARYIARIHQETQADRHAERTRSLTQALGALRQVQAAAWQQVDLDQGHERIVWDLFIRAAAQAAAQAGGLGGGNAVRPPTFHPQTARLLSVVLNAVRQCARLEFLDDPTAPSRAGDIPENEPKDAYWYVMMRRSDDEELARMKRQPDTTGEAAPEGATSAPPPDDATTPDADSASPDGAEAPNTAGGDPARPPFQVRDADGNIPMPHHHPRPAIRPDGTDDWYVRKRVPIPPRVPPRRAGEMGHGGKTRRPWEHSW